MIFDAAVKSGSLSQADLAIVEYISRNPEAVLKMTSRSLAAATFVSPSTVVRLCQKAGFGSFGNMKVALARELSSSEVTETVNPDYPQLADASSSQVASRISSLIRTTIRRTETILAEVNWTPIVDALATCGGVTICALSFSMDAATPFAQDLRRLGMRVTLCEEGSKSREWASTCPRDELFILVSYTGMTDLCINIASITQHRGLKSIAVVAEGTSTLSQMTTWVIPVALMQRRFALDRVANYQTLFAQSYALSVLYSLFFSRDYEKNRQTLKAMLNRQGIQLVQLQDGNMTMASSQEDPHSWINQHMRA